MYWANFLHIYQPPTQKPYWVKKIANEAYRKIIAGLKENPEAKLTLNVSAVLLELFEENNLMDIINDLRKLIKKGQVELTGSAKYHPLLPKLPEDEIIRQIEINKETHKKYFGDLFEAKGFFPPEMGYSDKVAKVAEKMGFDWVIVDELSFPENKGEIDYSKIYQVKNTKDFKIFFRERKMSWKILSGQYGTGNLLINSLGERLKKNEYLLTAMDGETFGHHRPGMEHLLFEIYESKKLKTVLISELPQIFKKREKIKPQPSTWALMEKDLERNAPFSRWEDPGNKIHQKQWQLQNLAIDSFKKYSGDDPAVKKIRHLLDRALHSDQFWWASAKPWWSLEMIEAGAKELNGVVQNLNKAPDKIKEKAKELYHEIVFTGFEWQRNGTVENLSKQEDEEIRQHTDDALPKMPKKEIDKIINNLKKEIKAVVEKEEYERAAQLRDRIKELKNYEKKK
ncbi:MAG: UvrB/UvrC motif-containing protein [Patescibacteria group bacterium]|nr:UvrB/UvrC motif-containing protein [Patescibacteria group bacterium]